MPHVMTTCIPKAHKGSHDALCYNTLRDTTLRILCAWKRCLIRLHNASSHSHKSRPFYTLFLSIMHQVCVPASVPSRHLGSTLSVLPEENDHTLMLIIMVLTHHIRNTLYSSSRACFNCIRSSNRPPKRVAAQILLLHTPDHFC